MEKSIGTGVEAPLPTLGRLAFSSWALLRPSSFNAKTVQVSEHGIPAQSLKKDVEDPTEEKHGEGMGLRRSGAPVDRPGRLQPEPTARIHVQRTDSSDG